MSVLVIGQRCLLALFIGNMPVQALAQGAVNSASLIGATVTSVAAVRQDSLRLREVLERAVQQHPAIEAAQARVRAAEGARMTARTLPNPVLSYWVENIRGSGTAPTTPLDRESQLTATLPLEPLFQRWPRIRRANSDVDAANADLARVRQLVMLNAARAFYRVAAAQVAVSTANDVRVGLAELVTYNAARVREGVTAEGDLIRIQLEHDRVAASVTFEQVELARAMAALSSYIGNERAGSGSVGDAVRIAIENPMSAAVTEPLPALATVMAQARQQRPDVRAAHARVAAANAEVSAQRTLAVRQLGATFGTKRTLGVTSLIAGVSLPLPLFDQNRGEVQRAASERSALQREAAWVEQQAMAEVAGALESYRLFRRQAAQLLGTFLARAEEGQRIALAAYQEGAVSLLQVLDASRTLADARTMYYRTIFAERQSLLELNSAIGVWPIDTPLAQDSGERL